MDTEGKEKSGFERGNCDPVNYQSPSVSSDWRNLEQMTNGESSMVVCKGDFVEASECSSASIVNAFGQAPWQNHSNLQNLGYHVAGFQNNASSSNTPGNSKPYPVPFGSGVDRTLDMDWVSASSMLKGGPFLANVSGVVPQSLTQLPADSGFIERAARFSCFNSGHFSDMVNPFASNEFMGVFPRGGGLMQWQQEAFSGNGMKSMSIENYHRNDINTGQASFKGISLSVDHGSAEGSPLKNERDGDVRTQDDAMVAADRSVNESDEGESSGKVGQVDPSVLEGADGQSTSKGVGSRKRKRTAKKTEVDQAQDATQQSKEVAKNCAENQQKEEQNPSPTTNKTSGKQEFEELQASDSQKEQYIHVRARRGQATNSHSLAERLRREKISQRMKFLQDLVPGCSKVTGKAVMLDEIINYVQSLQRQVEFLSMKLATVNPRLDFNIEELLSKEILQPQAGLSYTPGFHPEVPMRYPPGQPTQAGLVQSGLHDIGTSSDVLHRVINPPYAQITSGFKEPAQLARMWEDGLQNVVQMGLGAGDPSSRKLSTT